MDEQAKHVAIPRRFGLVMQEIWMLQPRFEDRSKKRVFRLLAHPRFRAAYDFLLLRAPEGAEVRALGEWWTRVQTLPHDALAEELSVPGAPPANAEGVANSVAPAKRRRRRSRKRSDASTPSG